MALPDPARASPRDLQSTPIATKGGQLYTFHHAKCIQVQIWAIRNLTCYMTVTYVFEIVVPRCNMCKELIRGA